MNRHSLSGMSFCSLFSAKVFDSYLEKRQVILPFAFMNVL